MSARIWNWPSRGGEDLEASQVSWGGDGTRLANVAPPPTIGIGGGSEELEGPREGDGGERTRVGVVGVETVELGWEVDDAAALLAGGRSTSFGKLVGARRM